MKKRDWAVAGAALLLLAGMYIGSKSQQRPQAADKTELIATSKDFINRLNRRDYAGCTSQFDDYLSKTMDADRMKQTFEPILDAMGDFVRFRSSTISRSNNPEHRYTICSIKCEYQEGTTTYTIIFDENKEIGGLYVK